MHRLKNLHASFGRADEWTIGSELNEIGIRYRIEQFAAQLEPGTLLNCGDTALGEMLLALHHQRQQVARDAACSCPDAAHQSA
jgi:hypothetical protein